MTDLMSRPIVQQAIQLYVQEPNITAQEVANRLGVSAKLIYNWRQNPNFIDAIYDKYMVEFGGELPAVLQAMLREAKAGNVQAARLILEHSGKLVKNVNITVDSPFEKFLKAERTEIEVEDAEVEEITDSIPDIEVELPKRKVENPKERTIKENKDIKKAIATKKRNERRRELHKWKKRAKAVGMESLPSRRPTPAQKEAWINEIKAKENE